MSTTPQAHQTAVFETLGAILSAGMRGIRNSVTPEDRRCGVLSLTRVADTKFLEFTLMKDEVDQEQYAASAELYGKGFPLALSLFLDDSVNAAGILFFPSSKAGDLDWADRLIQHAGIIVTLGELTAAAREGHIAVSIDGARCITFKCSGHGQCSWEGRTRANLWWIQHFRDFIAAATREMKEVGLTWGALIEEVSPCVSVWHEYHIAYRTTPGMEQKIHKVALNVFESMQKEVMLVGLDAGHGLDLANSVVAAIVSRALAHYLCCMALARKCRGLLLENLFTTWITHADEVAELSQGLGASKGEVEQVFRLLCATPRNYSLGELVAYPVPAPFVQIGDGMFLRSMCGHLCAPLHYLNQQYEKHIVGLKEYSIPAVSMGIGNYRMPLISEFRCGDYEIRIESEVRKN